MSRQSLSQKLRYEIFERDSFSCQYCGSKPPVAVLQVDHVVPVAEGGDNCPGNLITACSDCNLGKSKKWPKSAPQAVRQRLMAYQIIQYRNSSRGRRGLPLCTNWEEEMLYYMSSRIVPERFHATLAYLSRAHGIWDPDHFSLGDDWKHRLVRIYSDSVKNIAPAGPVGLLALAKVQRVIVANRHSGRIHELPQIATELADAYRRGYLVVDMVKDIAARSDAHGGNSRSILGMIEQARLSSRFVLAEAPF